ncbi:MAG: potassium-transporting ATPase subunit KdpC [Ktedonobacteraceae bacterium]|nr:potassium-transporting ATPase subunit KdpC [Ktedonobacteraceae bacterium]
MSTITPDTSGQTLEHTPERRPLQNFLKHYIRPAVVLTLILTIVTGFLYPGIVTGIAQLIFPYQANGSLIKNSSGQVIGSELIGQYWTLPQYFHGRPSATVNATTGTPEPYAADNSSPSNLGPTSATLVKSVQQRIAELKKENPNAPAGPVPIDLVTTSGSGLDPDISIAGALYQVPRIATARGLSQDQVTQLINSHETGRFLGIFGEAYVNVLDLNLALDALKK